MITTGTEMPTKKIRHVILDRDGVLNEEAPAGYVSTPAEWIWIPGVLDGLARLSVAGIVLSVATNQSCIGRGMIDMPMLKRIHKKMLSEALNIQFAGIYACPHVPVQGCMCRKPNPGLLFEAVRVSGILPEETIFVGDAETDLQAGLRAGIDSWLVRTGKGKSTEAMLKAGGIQGVDLEKVSIFNDLNDVCASVAMSYETRVKVWGEGE